MRPTHTVYITAHYVADRVGFLGTVLDAILGWDDCSTDVHLVTNSNALGAHESVREHERRFREAGSRLRAMVAEDLDHPFHLTWYHKRFIEPWKQSASADDLFIYLEDDIVLRRENLRHFEEYLPVLKPLGLLPGFIVFEQVADAAPVVVGLIRPEFYGHRNSVRIGDRIAHVCRNPYWAGYILDRELAGEYVGSRSFDINASRVLPWDLRARAAMGLCFEHVPRGFSARHAVVLEAGRPVDGALIWHCANTYARAGHPHYARIPLADAFVTGSALSYQIDRIRNRLATSAIRRREARLGLDPR